MRLDWLESLVYGSSFLLLLNDYQILFLQARFNILNYFLIKRDLIIDRKFVIDNLFFYLWLTNFHSGNHIFNTETDTGHPLNNPVTSYELNMLTHHEKALFAI